MSLSTGTRLGPYEIVDAIGAGGMGEVYRARDTRLDRVVAVKISAEQFSERFEREARAVAALNHPNICTLYDVGPNYLVMEYIEGPTLAQRISAGAIPLAEALPLARQIAEALEAAHEKGIVHRDLKPANIKLTHDGKVKVLDFGLAKAFETESAAGDSANSPTLTIASTRAGVILGTAGYMSPEQARGVPADKRADIWSYGVVLFEMLTGRHTFTGETISDTLASVLKTDPDWSALPPGTPPAMRKLLRRCLERDRKRRLRDIGDALLGLSEAPETVGAPPRQRNLLPWGAAALLLAATVWLAFLLWRGGPPAESSFQLAVTPPEKAGFTPLQSNTGGVALSPDGRTLAFVATQEGKTLLWVRRLDSLSARPLPGTQSAYYPFWSPDGRFLAFFADTKLKKIEVAGGPAQVICDAGSGRGGTWNGEGVIVFTGIDRTLHRVPAAGGQPVQISKWDAAYQENAHYWPSFLPDGRHFLYQARSASREKSAICAGSVDMKPGAGPRVELLKVASNAVYVPRPGERAGWLLFVRETTLYAQRFDPGRLKLEAEAFPIAERVGYVGNLELANFSASANGVLVYGRDIAEAGRLVWLSRDGKQSPVAAEPGIYFSPALSPDGSRLAIVRNESTRNSDIWLIELAHGISTRFTFDPATDFYPVWSPDGKQIAFSSTRQGYPQIFLKAASGAGNEEPAVPPSSLAQFPFDWSRDGRYILYVETGGSTGPDLGVLQDPKGATGERKETLFLQTPYNENQGQFSADGRWVAYTSDESGRYEVYVRSFAGTPAKFQLSSSGGVQPRWRADGRELYYLTIDGKLMAAGVKAAGDTLERETPKQLYEASWLAGGLPNAYLYAAARDGQRFLFVQRAEGEGTQPLTLVTNWQAGLKK